MMGSLAPVPYRLCIFNMADEGYQTAVVLLCGIPASGKSTLARNIQRHVQKTRGGIMHVIHVCYDDFIPVDLDLNESKLIDDTSQLHDENYAERITDENSVKKGDTCSFFGTMNSAKYSLWKQYRRRVIEAVDGILKIIESKDLYTESSFDAGVDMDGLEMEGLPSFREFWKTFQNIMAREERNCSCFASTDRR